MAKPRLMCLSTVLLTVLIGHLIMPCHAHAAGKDRLLEEFQQTFNKRRPRKEGIRRGGLCALSPGTDGLQKTFVIWSDRPLFLWQVDGNQTTVQHLRVLQSETDAIVWQQALQPRDRAVPYTGISLQPGQTYDWEITFQRNSFQQSSAMPTVDVLEYRFRVMPAVQRDKIATELQNFTTRLQANGSSPDEIALQQARYFADLGLLSDALQILYGLKSPSPEITQLLQDLTQSACHSTQSDL